MSALSRLAQASAGPIGFEKCSAGVCGLMIRPHLFDSRYAANLLGEKVDQ